MSFGGRLALVAAAFAALATLTSAAVPIYEAPDETIHLDYVFHLREGRGLPVMTGDPATTVAGQEAVHPPLYYAVAALVSLPADPQGYREAQRVNWYQQFDRRLPGNKNVVIHEPSEAFPFSGPTLAIHLARLASVLCGVVTVVFAGLAAREAGLADGAALLVSGFVAALPQFVFISAVTNNDNAVIAAATVAVYWSLRLLVRGATGSTLVGLGVAAGLAALAKVSGAAVGVLALAALLLGRWSKKPVRWRALVGDLLLFSTPAVALVGWWYARNLVLYGDPLGWDKLLALADAIVRRDMSPAALGAELMKLRESSWALFGWGNVGLPDWAYLTFDAVVAAAAAGWAVRLWQRPVFRNDGVTPYRAAALLLTVWCATFALLVARWIVLIDHGGQGRLWFPAIAPFAILLVSGLARLAPRARLALPALLVAGLAAFSVAAPWTVIRPAYASPAPPEGPVPENVRAPFSPGLELVGFRIVPARAAPGDVATLWLWWRADRPVEGDFAVRLRVLARDFRPVLERVSYPAAGTMTFSRLSPGAVLADSHSLFVPRDLDPPDYLRLEVDLLDRRSGMVLASNRGPVTVGPLRVTGGAWPPPGMEPVSLAVGKVLRLDATRVEQYPPERAGSGGSLALLLAWTANAPARQASARVALLDSQDTVVLAVERGLGSWHPVQVWQRGDRFVDELDVELPADLPAGTYRLHLTLNVDGERAKGAVAVVRR